MFGGFGPIVLSIIYLIISKTKADFVLDATEASLAIVSIYLLAFAQAGATVFTQIEEWSLPKTLFCHFLTLYVAYVLCYTVNTWIPFDPKVILIFTLIFAGVFFAIWFTVYFCVKATSKKFNKKIG